jgi:hypothetical protein
VSPLRRGCEYRFSQAALYTMITILSRPIFSPYQGYAVGVRWEWQGSEEMKPSHK